VETNLLYLANLTALEQWYIYVRKPFFDTEEFGDLMYSGLLDKLSLAKKERIKKLTAMAEKGMMTPDGDTHQRQNPAGRKEFHEKIKEVATLFGKDLLDRSAEPYRDDFLSSFHKIKKAHETNYIEVIQGLPADISEKGTLWLDKIIDTLCRRATAIMPSLNLFTR
jgi:UDP-N-acetylglucosamine/UDP-N-acetylgalactosamine diphosphorylase